MKVRPVDRTFLISVATLVLVGFFIFSSALMGIQVREDLSYSSLAIKQFAVGIVGGLIALLVCAKVDYVFWRKNAFYAFICALLFNTLVFIPGIGFDRGGAHRWLSFGSFTFQPSEILKIATVIYFAAWASGLRKERIQSFMYGPFALMCIAGISTGMLLLQKDTDLTLPFALLSMFIAAGAKWRHVLLVVAIGVVALVIVATVRPYIRERLTVFLNPSQDAYGSGYQIKQSLIAIGAGGITGRGFGKSIQKFSYLPEPIGDSIFAVAAEEFGFAGSVVLISLFIFFASRGLKISSNAKDPFGRLLALGIVILLISQAFINIGSMAGVFPLTGVPLTFVSHGGSALLIGLASVGIVLNISRYQKRGLESR